MNNIKGLEVFNKLGYSTIQKIYEKDKHRSFLGNKENKNNQ